jgi:hypothetical protein
MPPGPKLRVEGVRRELGLPLLLDASEEAATDPAKFSLFLGTLD